MYEEGSDTDDVLSVLACTQKLIDSNERVLADIDGQQRDYKAAIDELRDKQEQVMTLLNEIKASSPNTRLGGGSSKAYINREVSVSLDLFHVGVVRINTRDLGGLFSCCCPNL